MTCCPLATFPFESLLPPSGLGTVLLCLSHAYFRVLRLNFTCVFKSVPAPAHICTVGSLWPPFFVIHTNLASLTFWIQTNSITWSPVKVFLTHKSSPWPWAFCPVSFVFLINSDNTYAFVSLITLPYRTFLDIWSSVLSGFFSLLICIFKLNFKIQHPQVILS